MLIIKIVITIVIIAIIYFALMFIIDRFGF